MTSVRNIFTLSLLVTLVAACSSTPINTGDENGAKIESLDSNSDNLSTENRAVPTIEPPSSSEEQAPQLESELLTKRSVYFDLDEYVIKPEYRNVIQAHAKYLVSHPNRQIVIQGHTDERGGSEYNLALGQKRADTVRQLMKALGVSHAQVETISFGKEKPKAYGSNEQAWAENRRADIVYQ